MDREGKYKNMKKWYIKVDGKQQGPFVIEELQKLKSQKKFGCDTLTWHLIGNKFDWLKASEIDSFRPLFGASRTEDDELEGIFRDEFYPSRPLLKDKPDKIWAIASGKGGVGKTLLASTFAILLSKAGKKTVVVDLDLGGSNLHTVLGLAQPDLTLDHFITKKVQGIQDVCIPTPFEHLSLISGLSGCLGYANPKYVQKVKLISKLREIDADYVILDIGAGNSYNELDFFLSADRHIVVTCPDPSSIQDAYHFIKTALYRKLGIFFRRHEKVVEFLKLCREQGYSVEMRQLLSQIFELGPEYLEMFGSLLKEYTPELIVNMAMDRSEGNEGKAVIAAARKLLNIDVGYLGFVSFDLDVRKSVKALKPFVLNPECQASLCVLNILFDRILKLGGMEATEQKKRVKEILKETKYVSHVRDRQYNDFPLIA